MNRVLISVGSNINTHKNIQLAIEYLKEICEIEKISELIQTLPIGIIDQPNFTNGVIQCITNQPQLVFNESLKIVEDRVGRDRTRAKFGPREIDLDIIKWNGSVVDSDYYSRTFLQELEKTIAE